MSPTLQHAVRRPEVWACSVITVAFSGSEGCRISNMRCEAMSAWRCALRMGATSSCATFVANQTGLPPRASVTSLRSLSDAGNMRPKGRNGSVVLILSKAQPNCAKRRCAAFDLTLTLSNWATNRRGTSGSHLSRRLSKPSYAASISIICAPLAAAERIRLGRSPPQAQITTSGFQCATKASVTSGCSLGKSSRITASEPRELNPSWAAVISAWHPWRVLISRWARSFSARLLPTSAACIQINSPSGRGRAGPQSGAPRRRAKVR
mmetsp:Transcript_23247/g.40025  ORF Transcript_23247/g.40025 Transcript_23247/m.40025 type:complete len:265 (-) Transcript_23247:6156-6950(-)